MKKLFLSVLVLIIVSACNKQPNAAFTTDKTVYSPGETVTLTNKSQSGKDFIWTLPNGQSTEKDASYTIKPEQKIGTLIFRLDALSKNGKKVSSIEHTVYVEEGKGDIMFWNCTSCKGIPPIHVTINGLSQDVTGFYATQPPNCGADRCATFYGLKEGTYPYSAYDDNGTNWSGNVTVTRNNCNAIVLQ